MGDDNLPRGAGDPDFYGYPGEDENSENKNRLAKISILKSLVNLPKPTDENWSEEFESGVQQGFKIYEAKIKFQITRLKKLAKASTLEGF